MTDRIPTAPKKLQNWTTLKIFLLKTLKRVRQAADQQKMFVNCICDKGITQLNTKSVQ